MSHEAAIAAIQHERPALVPTLKALIAAATAQPDLRTIANTLLADLIAMQQVILDQRTLAQQCLREQPCALTDDGRKSYHCIRHTPDVMLRKLCAIAGVTHLTNAEPEWLDKMEAKHAND